jgi:hypothetical protein
MAAELRQGTLTDGQTVRRLAAAVAHGATQLNTAADALRQAAVALDPQGGWPP